jgi:hypothetical protein
VKADIPRPKEFLDALKALEVSVRRVKKLYAVGTEINEERYPRKHVLTFVAPGKLTFRRTNEDGKTLLYFVTDGKTTTIQRQGERRPTRKKGLDLSDDITYLGKLLLDPTALKNFGEADSENVGNREYTVTSSPSEIRYNGGDSIGRDQSGLIRLDSKFGLPIKIETYQSANHPSLDPAHFDNGETWTVLQVTKQ